MPQLELRKVQIIRLHFDVKTNTPQQLKLLPNTKVVASCTDDRNGIVLQYMLSLQDEAQVAMRIDLTANSRFHSDEPLTDDMIDQLIPEQCIPAIEQEISVRLGDITERMGFNRLELEPS